MHAKTDHARADTLPSWVKGRLSLFAFQALKAAKAPYGSTAKPATMRKLADQGLVRRVESGAYVVTRDGQDLIEGCFRCPPEYDSNGPSHEWYPRSLSKEAVERVPARAVGDQTYTVEPAAGGCSVIRLGTVRRLRSGIRRI